MNSAEVLIKFKGDTSDVDKDTKKLTSSMGGLTKSMTMANLASSAITKGLGLMTQNMDRAIQRIDTMDNFPKVMQNFGVSADEASASIKRIDKSVQGLPTSLDQAVAGVQDLFMVTKDLKQSEQLFKAVNDSAMVFANGSTEAVDRFIYGYKQAMSAGKVSAQDFNQMNEAIPGLMSKVAEKMGVTYKELKEGLSNGSISIEQFNNALKSLDTEGVGAMEALEKSAHTATGGIQTSIANMKTAFARGVAGIIKSVDGALQPFGGLTGVITKLGKIGEEVFKTLGEALKEVLPMLIDIAKKIMPIITKTFKQLSPILQKLGQALLPAIQKIIDALLPALTRVMEKIMPVIMNILEQLIPLIDPLADYIVAMVNYTMALMEPLLDIASVILPPLVSILSVLVQTILPVATSILKVMTTVITAVWNALKAVFDFIANNWKTILTIFINPFVGAFKLLHDNCEGFRTFINNFVNAIKNFFSGLASKIGSVVNSIVGFIKSIPSKIAGVANSIKNVFVNLPSQFLNIGSNIMHGLWNGISGLKDWVISKVKGLGKSILNGLKSALGIHSPSKEFALIGKFSVLGYTEALDKMSKDVDKQVASTFGISPQLTGSMQNSFSPNVNVVNNVNVEQDPLGQMVRTIKTYSGGSPNDYNYGAGY
jgi:tape measure domain-containing protein